MGSVGGVGGDGTWRGLVRVKKVGDEEKVMMMKKTCDGGNGGRSEEMNCVK